jgi:hypothetical protein
MSVNRQNTDEELVRDSRRQQITETANETRARSGAACRGSHERHSCRSVAVEVGFEPTDELPHHTLSSTARHRPPVVPIVRHVHMQPPRGQWRTVPNGGE